MKQVAGTLRLELAQFRELEAFVQFASELDKATQAQIARGQRLVELLKQPPNKPVPVEKQVAIIYAGTKGYLDDVPVNAIQKFEQEFYTFLDTEKPEVLEMIRAEKKITDEIETKLKEAIEEFKRKLHFREVEKNG